MIRYFLIAAAGCSDGNLGPLTSQGCASAAWNAQGPQITPFCHQMGRHPTVLRANATEFRRIPARISPDRSHPLNLNSFFHFFGPVFHEKCGFLTHFRINSAAFWTNKLKNAIFGDIFCPCKERAVGSTGVSKNTPLGSPGGPYGAPVSIMDR